MKPYISLVLVIFPEMLSGMRRKMTLTLFIYLQAHFRYN